jgi:CBS domain containing-hemolysin-like protein
MSPQATVEVIVLCVCVVLSALASGTETALTSVGRLRVRHLAEEGSKAAAKLQKLQADPNRFLSTVLFVNTVALIMASSMSTLLSVEYLPHSVGFWGDLAVALVLSIFLLIFAEVTPKSLAIRQAERIALLAAGPVEGLSRVLAPVLWFISRVAVAITGGRAARAPYLSEQELLTILAISEEQGVIEEEEREMIHGIIEIGDTAGLITLEDLLEEIVGEIRDEYDDAEPEQLKLVSETEALVDARFPMAELNDRLSLGIQESAEYDSVGGYVFSMVGIPERDTTFESNGVKWVVEEVDGQRVKRVRLLSQHPWPDEALVEAGMKPVSRDSRLPGEDLVDNLLGEG